MTPQGENEQPDDDTGQDPDATLRRSNPRPPAPDFGWGDPKSAQPPGPRITWESSSTSELPERSPAISSEADRSGRPSQPDDDIPPPPGAPGGLPAGVPVSRPAAPARPAPPARPTAPTTVRTPPTPPRVPPTPPVATTIRLEDSEDRLRSQLRQLADQERETSTAAPEPPAPTPEASPTPAPVAFAPPASMEPPAPPAPPAPPTSTAPAPPPPPAPPAESPADRRAADRTGSAVAELSQQLAATQSQVAAIGAQLTTLSHRISYDLERGAQTTSERILRDLAELPDTIRKGVGGDLGPALDDLTDQVETDRTALTTAVEGVQGALAPRLASIGEIVDGLPLTNVEILSALATLGTDLEDRFTRFATRVGDQLTALERANVAEVTRLRTQIDELRATVARPAASTDTLDRMAGQVERLVQKTPQAEEVVEALELLVSEHLEVLRDNIDTRVAALAPAMQEELEAVRAESLAGVAATEEVLAERIEILEATLAERMDLALADQVESVDALLNERHEVLLGAVQAVSPDVDLSQIDEVAEAVAESTAGTAERIEELAGALAELRELVTALAEAPAPAPVEASGDAAAALAGVADELKALRRRISLRLESDDSAGMSEQQIAVLAAHIANHLH